LRPASLRDNAVSASASNVNWVKSIAWTVNLSGVSPVIGFDAHPIRTSALSEIVRVDDHRPTLGHIRDVRLQRHRVHRHQDIRMIIRRRNVVKCNG
jgi:hypothetical protein